MLEQSAPGYLDDHDWDSVGNGDSLHEDWLEQALAETARPAKGARGPLTRIRPRPGDPTTNTGQPCYRLADYLEQTGGHERGAVYPPESLWTTVAATVTDPVLLRHLGGQARQRGRYQHAIWLYTRAAGRGDAGALTDLAWIREEAGDSAGAEFVAVQGADRGNIIALNFLAGIGKKAGDTVGAEALYRQGVDRGNVAALRDLARLREEAGDAAGAEALYRQAADRGDVIALVFFSRFYEQSTGWLYDHDPGRLPAARTR